MFENFLYIYTILGLMFVFTGFVLGTINFKIRFVLLIFTGGIILCSANSISVNQVVNTMNFKIHNEIMNDDTQDFIKY